MTISWMVSVDVEDEFSIFPSHTRLPSPRARIQRGAIQETVEGAQVGDFYRGQLALLVPRQEHVDLGNRFGGWQPPQIAAHDILADQMFGQEAQADAGHDHAPYLFDIGRGAHDASRKTLLIPKDGQG